MMRVGVIIIMKAGMFTENLFSRVITKLVQELREWEKFRPFIDKFNIH